MKRKQHGTPTSRLDPVGDGSTWPWFVSPLTVALAFALMIAGLYIGSCGAD
jgi:hypothetical protein